MQSLPVHAPPLRRRHFVSGRRAGVRSRPSTSVGGFSLPDHCSLEEHEPGEPPDRDHRGRRHRPRGRGRGAQGDRRDRRALRRGALRPRRRPLPRAPARCCPTRCSRSCAGYDAILLGAVGTPDVPPGVLERGLLLKLRFALDLFVNLRPFSAPASELNDGVDMVVIRENTEGTYAGEGGFLRHGTPLEVAHPGIGEHPVRRRALHPLRVRPRPVPAAPAPDARAQDERPDVRRRPLAAHLQRGRGRVPGRHDRLRPRRRGLHPLRAAPGALRRDRDRQPLRRHPHRPRWRDRRAASGAPRRRT